MENIVTITLLYLTLLGNIEMTSFEIPSKESCESWFHYNVKEKENKKRTLFSSHTYHLYKDKKVIGYICSDDIPQ
jgi:hypothetical protein